MIALDRVGSFYVAGRQVRVTGKPTFGIVQFGPGSTYLPASIIDSFWASSPLVSISGTTNTRTRFRFEYQELEQTSMFPAFTKWAGDLPQPERIADVLRTAVRASVSGGVTAGAAGAGDARRQGDAGRPRGKGVNG